MDLLSKRSVFLCKNDLKGAGTFPAPHGLSQSCDSGAAVNLFSSTLLHTIRKAVQLKGLVCCLRIETSCRRCMGGLFAAFLTIRGGFFTQWEPINQVLDVDNGKIGYLKDIP